MHKYNFLWIALTPYVVNNVNSLCFPGDAFVVETFYTITLACLSTWVSQYVDPFTTHVTEVKRHLEYPNPTVECLKITTATAVKLN